MFVFVFVFAGGGLVPPPDSEANGKEATIEDATEERGVGLQSTGFNPGPHENLNVTWHLDTQEGTCLYHQWTPYHYHQQYCKKRTR